MKHRLVFVANHVPIPWVNGIAFQEWEDLRLLVQTHQVTLLALDNGDLGSQEADEAVGLLRLMCDEVAIFARARSPKIMSALRRGRGIISGLPATMVHNIRADCRAHLAAVVAKHPDIDIFLSNFFVASIITGVERRGGAMIRLHNHESDFAREAMRAEDRPIRKLMLLLDLALTHTAEHRLFRGLHAQDCILTCSESDRTAIEQRYRTSARVDYLPLCPPTHTSHVVAAQRGPRDPVVVFTGILDNPFNVSGIQWFVQDVWHTIREQVPGARLLIAGRHPSAAVLALGAHPGVHVIANPSNISEILNQACVAIAPIFYGSGVKQKCLEAFSSGIPLVTTRKGAEGLGARPGRDYILADSTQEFSTGVVELLRNVAARDRISASALEYLDKGHGEAVRREILARALGAG